MQISLGSQSVQNYSDKTFFVFTLILVIIDFKKITVRMMISCFAFTIINFLMPLKFKSLRNKIIKPKIFPNYQNMFQNDDALLVSYW